MKKIYQQKKSLQSRMVVIWIICILLLSVVAACQSNCNREQSHVIEDADDTNMTAEISSELLSDFKALPSVVDNPKNPLTDEKVSLGRMLYFDKRLSKDQTVSCNTCHQLDAFGVDGKVVSDGIQAQKGSRNSPTVFNAAGHFLQFWDGREPDVEAQAKGPITNPIEMGMHDAKEVESVLKSISGYEALFKSAFPGDEHALSFDNLALAIGAFERKLITPSRWDAFLKERSSNEGKENENNNLTEEEKIGFKTFVETGCPTCHSGAFIGGQMFQKLGLVHPWIPNSNVAEGAKADLGKFEVSGVDSDKMLFKVPSLRNIEHTAPYLHDGSETNLKQMVIKMAHHQLGRDINDEQATSIVTWLKTLTGRIDPKLIKEPILPE